MILLLLPQCGVQLERLQAKMLEESSTGMTSVPLV